MYCTEFAQNVKTARVLFEIVQLVVMMATLPNNFHMARMSQQNIVNYNIMNTHRSGKNWFLV